MSDETDRSLAEHANKLWPRLKGRIYATQHLAHRAISTAKMIDWILRPEQQSLRDEIRHTRGGGFSPIDPEIATRMTVLRSISPLGVDPGPKSEIALALITSGINMIEWKEVVIALDEAQADREVARPDDPGVS